ncbi:MAG: hypothetical protein ABIJ57_04225 [Pseudomonadota bacterium]
MAETATDGALIAQIDIGIVRPAMGQKIRHPSQESFLDRGAREIKFSADAAH